MEFILILHPKKKKVFVCIWISLILLKTENNKKKKIVHAWKYYAFTYLHWLCLMNSTRAAGLKKKKKEKKKGKKRKREKM